MQLSGQLGLCLSLLLRIGSYGLVRICIRTAIRIPVLYGEILVIFEIIFDRTGYSCRYSEGIAIEDQDPETHHVPDKI